MRIYLPSLPSHATSYELHMIAGDRRNTAAPPRLVSISDRVGSLTASTAGGSCNRSKLRPWHAPTSTTKSHIFHQVYIETCPVPLVGRCCTYTGGREVQHSVFPGAGDENGLKWPPLCPCSPICLQETFHCIFSALQLNPGLLHLSHCSSAQTRAQHTPTSHCQDLGPHVAAKPTSYQCVSRHA